MRTRGLEALQKRAISRGPTRRIEDGKCVGDDFMKGYSICAMAGAITAHRPVHPDSYPNILREYPWLSDPQVNSYIH